MLNSTDKEEEKRRLTFFGWQRILLQGLSVFQLRRVEVLDSRNELLFALLLLDSYVSQTRYTISHRRLVTIRNLFICAARDGR